jgi:hypothetical protein
MLLFVLPFTLVDALSWKMVPLMFFIALIYMGERRRVGAMSLFSGYELMHRYRGHRGSGGTALRHVSGRLVDEFSFEHKLIPATRATLISTCSAPSCYASARQSWSDCRRGTMMITSYSSGRRRAWRTTWMRMTAGTANETARANARTVPPNALPCRGRRRQRIHILQFERANFTTLMYACLFASRNPVSTVVYHAQPRSKSASQCHVS